MATDTRVDMSDLKDLDPLSKRLNAASDQLTHTLQTIQERLNALAIGLEVWVDDPLSKHHLREVLDANDEPTGRREYDTHDLGYGRLGDGWALIVRERRHVETPTGYNNDWDTESFQDYGVLPLLKASRELRVAAVPLLPQLIEAIERDASVVLERVEQAKRIADSLT
jgi:hypothetical protein